MDWAEQELNLVNFGDQRLDRRAQQMLSRLGDKPTTSIPAACNGWSETKAAYRLLDNGRVTSEKLLAPHRACTLARVEGEKTVLCIEDTSELDYTSKSDIDGLGPLNYEARQGLYLHPMVAVTPDRLCHGVLDCHALIRDEGSLGADKDRQRSIEEKESLRWLEGYRGVCELSKEQPTTEWIYVADREADIYEIYAEYLRRQGEGQASGGFVVRSQHDRLLVGGEKLWAAVENSPVLGEMTFDMPGNASREARPIEQTIQATKVLLKAPYRADGKLPAVEVTAILAREKRAPTGEEPIEWLLLTHRAVATFEQAMEVLQWYLCRWQIEIFFKILKSGCKIEELQLERITRLEPALAFYMIVAWRVLYLTMLGRECPELPCDVVFGEEEWKAVYIVCKKQPPPEEPPTLDSMIRMVAGFGGFLNRKHDGFPEPKTIWIGIQRCRDSTLAIESHKELGRQNYG
jgi:hypothetical protein